jgi:hypothetical protein
MPRSQQRSNVYGYADELWERLPYIAAVLLLLFLAM